MPDKFIVNKSYNNSRLDKWLKEEVINLPNSLIQKLLRKNQIKVNNRNGQSFIRSATVPDTIDAVAAQNISWKK